MIQVSKKIEYSIALIAHMARKNEKNISLSLAAKQLVLPYRFLSQLAAKLKAGGILESKEGKMGGYSLVAGWENKTLFDLVAALGENRRMVKCMDGDGCPRMAGCSLVRIWSKLEENFVSNLKEIKLNEI